MNANQEEFVASFRAFDSARMGEAVCVMLNQIFGEPLGQTLTREMHKESAAFLAGFMKDHSQSYCFPVKDLWPGLRYQTSYDERGADPQVYLKLFLADETPAKHHALWSEHGYTSDPIAIGRTELHPPLPFRWEGGDWQAIGTWEKSAARSGGVTSEHDAYRYALAQSRGADSEWIRRYAEGECEAVWTEIVAMGAEIRTSDKLGDAVAVARETMRRARENILLLDQELPKIGYKFQKRVRVKPPSDSVLTQIAKVERKIGALPLSICAWYEIVGSVDFTGDFLPPNEWACGIGVDPLVIFPSSAAFNVPLRHNINVINVAPDENTKNGEPREGGYYMDIPNAAADGPLAEEWHETNFVDYLRMCFRNAGLPTMNPDRLEPTQKAEFDKLMAKLLPI
ncbi:hypothetical protein CCAX7_33370 [Capsulimonas corticalis]|uniref:Uncharacterized protein n=1 Tax=Capsulimonas corticalis TaxID=2219043 RepID=A0A402CYL9_9BACT|nr:hypothetical protein [Capsulimonas corticalis]BDI31286.1 hypothetical protein CCAX7_33370 [Capsulimonas corticalis]